MAAVYTRLRGIDMAAEKYHVSPHIDALLAALSGRDLSAPRQAELARELVTHAMLGLVKDFREWVRIQAARQGVHVDYD